MMTAKILSVSSFAISAVLWGMASYYMYRLLQKMQQRRTRRYNEAKGTIVLAQKRLGSWALNIGKDWLMALVKAFIVIQYFGLLVISIGYVYAAPWLTPEVYQSLSNSEHVVATITWCAIPIVCAVVLLLVRTRARRGVTGKKKWSLRPQTQMDPAVS